MNGHGPNEAAWELPIPLRPAHGAQLKVEQLCTTLRRRALADVPRGAKQTPLPAGTPGLSAQIRQLHKPRLNAKRRLPEPRVRREVPTHLYQNGQLCAIGSSPPGSPTAAGVAEPAGPTHETDVAESSAQKVEKVVLKLGRPKTRETDAERPSRSPGGSPVTPPGPLSKFLESFGASGAGASSDRMSVYLPPISGAANSRLEALSEEDRDTGFDTLLQSLEWMISKKEGTVRGNESLQEAWEEAGRQLVRWKDDDEVRRVAPFLDAISVAAESLLDTVDPSGALNERDLKPDKALPGPPPNVIGKAAVICAACLRPLLRVASRTYPQLRRCADTTERLLLGCLFLRPPSALELSRITPPPISIVDGGKPFMCNVGDGVEELVAPFQGKRTYAQAAGLLSRRLVQQGDMIEKAVRNKDRAAAGMERISRYWRFHLQGVLFRIWRSSCRKRRKTCNEDELLKIKLSELEEKHKKLARESAAKLQKAVAEVEQLRMQLSGFNDIHKKLLKEKETVKGLNEKLDTARAELEEQREDYEAQLEQERDKYTELVKVFERTQHALLGNSYEQARRLKYKDLLDRDIDEKALLEWLNAMVKEELEERKERYGNARKWKKNPFAKVSFTLNDFCQGAKALDCYWALLAAISPGHVPDDQLLRNWEESDATTKAKRLFAMVEEMGMHVGLDYNNILAESAENHELLISTLFNRWCGATPAVVQFKPVDTAEDRRTSYMAALEERGALDVKAIQEMSAKKEEQSALWRTTAKKATKNVMAKVTEVMKTGNSSALSSDEQSEWPMFTDLTPSKGRLPKEVKEEDMVEIHEILRSNFRKNRKVFLRYAGDDKDMSQDEFWRMCSDARIPDKQFNRKALAEVFMAANTGCDPGDVQLDGAEWTVAVVRLALGKMRKTQISAAEKVTTLLERHLFLYCTAETDEFKLQIYQPTVQDVLQKNKTMLKKIFRWYAADDGPGQKPNSIAELSAAEFRKMVRESEISDSVCTFAALDTLFMELQGDLQVRGGTGMLYHEFAEMVCGMAVFKFPLPTLPMHMKLHNFLEKLFIPKIQPKIRTG